MRKFVVFVLCAALSCGFVGCGEKDGPAKTLYRALSKVGDLTLEAEYKDTVSYHSFDNIPVAEQIVFRMPDEERDIHAERACYIEVYFSENDLEKIVNSEKNDYIYGMYSYGNIILFIDGYVTDHAASKYVEAFEKAVGGEVALRNEKERKVEKDSLGFVPSDGVGAREVYEALKKKMDNIAFHLYGNAEDNEYVSFYDTSLGYDSKIIITIRVLAEDAKKSMDYYFNYDEHYIVRGNVGIGFEKKLSDERTEEYVKVLEKIAKE